MSKHNKEVEALADSELVEGYKPFLEKLRAGKDFNGDLMDEFETEMRRRWLLQQGFDLRAIPEFSN